MIVGFAGFAGAGKDTAAQVLIEAGWTRRGLADTLKDLALKINPIINPGDWRSAGIPVSLAQIVRDNVEGWDGAKQNSEVRRFLQNLGQAGREEFGIDFWIGCLLNWKDENQVENLVVPDIRYENEVLVLPDLCFWIDRPGVGPVNDHVSDQGEPRAWCTDEIRNVGSLEEFRAEVRQVLMENGVDL